VSWPSKKEVTNSTVVVILTGAFATVYLALLDRLGVVTSLVMELCWAMQLTQEFATKAEALAMAKKWYVIQTYSGYEKQGEGRPPGAHSAVHMEEKDSRDPDSHRTVQDVRAGGKTRVRRS